MAIRRLNFTGRKRLDQADIRITINAGDASKCSFEAELKLADYRLPDDGIVFIEAYRQTTLMRFNFGAVGLIHAPENLALSEFNSHDAILFRVKITSGTERKGLLLAEADRIHPKQPDDREEKRAPLLQVKSDENLGEQIFKIDFSDRPILLVNRKAGDWRALAKQPIFVALVYPSVLREILTRVLKIEEYDDPDERDDWRAQWLRFALLLDGVRDVPDVEKDSEEDVDDWIEEVTLSFCRQFHMLKYFERFSVGTESS